MSGRARLVGVAAPTWLLVGCGGGGPSDRPASEPSGDRPGQERGADEAARADRARARQLLVRLTDLPTGWASRPHETSPDDERAERELRACLGAGTDPGRTADLSSNDFSMGQAQVTSRVTVATTDEDARREFAAPARPEFGRCLAEVTRRRVQQPGGQGPGEVAVVALPVEPLADGLLAHRLTITRSTVAGRQVQYVDLFLMLSGRAQVSVNFSRTQTPPPPELERSVRTKIADRARG